MNATTETFKENKRKLVELLDKAESAFVEWQKLPDSAGAEADYLCAKREAETALRHIETRD
jgi:hypothetical protein